MRPRGCRGSRGGGRSSPAIAGGEQDAVSEPLGDAADDLAQEQAVGEERHVAAVLLQGRDREDDRASSAGRPPTSGQVISCNSIGSSVPSTDERPEVAGPGRHVGVMVTDQQPSYAVAVIRSHLILRRHHERAAILAGQQGVGVRMARERFPLGIDAQERTERTAGSAPGRPRCRGDDSSSSRTSVPLRRRAWNPRVVERSTSDPFGPSQAVRDVADVAERARLVALADVGVEIDLAGHSGPP